MDCCACISAKKSVCTGKSKRPCDFPAVPPPANTLGAAMRGGAIQEEQRDLVAGEGTDVVSAPVVYFILKEPQVIIIVKQSLYR